MSENLDLVRSIHADWERGDFQRVDWADAGIEFVFADGPAPGTYTGLAGTARGWREFLGAWDDYRVEASEHRPVDAGCVLTLFTISGRGKTSGLLAANHGANVCHIRDGKVTRLVMYFERSRAIADLGLKG